MKISVHEKECNFKVVEFSLKCGVESNNAFQKILCKIYQTDVLKLSK